MAPKSQVSKDFLKQVLIGEKRLLKKKDVEYIHVSQFEELSVKNLWGEMKEDKDFMIYFQDDYPKDRYPCREYFFNILNTVYEERMTAMIAHSNRIRFEAAKDGIQ